MEFAETYRQEVIASRRNRSHRALFWSRIVGIILMLTVVAILRTEPEFRKVLITAGSDAIIALVGRGDVSARPTGDPSLTTSGKKTEIQISTRPRDRVKVNRPGQGSHAHQGFDATIDAEALSRKVGTQLQDMKLRP